MKIAVWGAGAIGSGLVYRLATTLFTSEIAWINRNYENIASRVIDIEQGLAFAPACHNIEAHPQEDAARALFGAGLLIVTLGAPVGKGQIREDLYPKNREICHQAVIPALQQGYSGVVLTVTNPVDLIARFLQKGAGLPAERVLGLGTVVETARLQASLGSYLSPRRPAREVWACAIGTHDERFVPVVRPSLGVGATIPPAVLADITECARREVAGAAARVKADEKSTLHPIVEGAVRVAEAIALDRQCLLTVSVRDQACDLYYSLPATVGAGGVSHIHRELLEDPVLQARLDPCLEGLRQTLAREGEI